MVPCLVCLKTTNAWNGSKKTKGQGLLQHPVGVCVTHKATTMRGIYFAPLHKGKGISTSTSTSKLHSPGAALKLDQNAVPGHVPHQPGHLRWLLMGRH